MARTTRTTLKTYFNTGDTPTEAQFIDLIDSPLFVGDAISADVLTDGTTNKAFLATERTKLAAIEAAADVTDATNVLAAGAVMTTGTQAVTGVKIFSSSPVVPAPTTDLQAATKKYVDDAVTAGGGYTDEAAQDAVGSILDTEYLEYVDAAPSISLSAAALASLALANSALQEADITGKADKASMPVTLTIACSDETTALTTGTAKVTFRMPHAMTLTGVRASVTTAPTGGTLLTVDVNETGTSVLSTKLTFDASEKTTTTATTTAVISYTALADDAEITIDVDAIGSTVAGAGLKVTLIGTRSI